MYAHTSEFLIPLFCLLELSTVLLISVDVNSNARAAQPKDHSTDCRGWKTVLGGQAHPVSLPSLPPLSLGKLRFLKHSKEDISPPSLELRSRSHQDTPLLCEDQISATLGRHIRICFQTTLELSSCRQTPFLICFLSSPRCWINRDQLLWNPQASHSRIQGMEYEVTQ